MSVAGNFFVRWRVRLGYPLAIALLYFSRPTPPSILVGALTGIIGLGVRAYAAGYLHKQEVLTIAGPYAYTRNPLYLGSAILALGAGIATRSWISALILIVYFAVFYSIVMQREAKELQLRHGASFEDYARAVISSRAPSTRTRTPMNMKKEKRRKKNIRRSISCNRGMPAQRDAAGKCCGDYYLR